MYGNPSYKVFEAADRKEVKLGGCIVEPSRPSWNCTACNRDF